MSTELFFKIEQPILTGTRIKELREEMGLSQDQLAKHTGVARGTIARFESSGEEIKKVSDYVAFQQFFLNKIENEENTNAQNSTPINQEEEEMLNNEIIANLGKLIKRLEAENKDLKRQVDELSGSKVKTSAS